MIENQYIVTLILNKVGKKGSGECPLGGECDAPHGRHHSLLVWALSAQEAREKLQNAGYYVARVEVAHFSG